MYSYDVRHGRTSANLIREFSPALIPILLIAILLVSDEALGIGRNDDWVYIRSSIHFAQTGEFHPFTSTAYAVGQVVLGAGIYILFGSGIAPFQLVTFILGIASLFVTFLLSRNYLPLRASRLVVFTLACGPIFMNLAVSYMTDIPAYLFAVTTLYVGSESLKFSGKRSFALFLSALTIGGIGFTFREFVIAAPLALIVIHVRRLVSARTSRTEKWVYVATVLAWSLAILSLFLWRKSLAEGIPVQLAPNFPEAIKAMFRSWFSFAILCAPIAFASAPGKIFASFSSRRKSIALAILGAITTGWWFLRTNTGLLFQGNYIKQSGPYSETLIGNAEPIFPDWVWAVIEFSALVSALLLALQFLALFTTSKKTILNIKPTVPLVGTAFFIFGVTLFLSSFLFSTPTLDRNLIFLVATGAITLLSGSYRKKYLAESKIPMRISLTLLMSLSMYLTSASFSFDRLKWDTAETVANKFQIKSSGIAGSYEWIGIYRDGISMLRAPDASGKYSGWVSLFPAAPVCAVLAHFSELDMLSEDKLLLVSSRRSSLGATAKIVAYKGPDEFELCR